MSEEKKSEEVEVSQADINREAMIQNIHDFRKKIDGNIKVAKMFLKSSKPYGYGREMALVHTKLQEAKMWAGKCLEAMDSPFPEELRDEAEAVKMEKPNKEGGE